MKCSFLYQKTVSTKRKWIVSEIYYTPGNKISLTTHFQALPGASMKNLDRYNHLYQVRPMEYQVRRFERHPEVQDPIGRSFVRCKSGHADP